MTLREDLLEIDGVGEATADEIEAVVGDVDVAREEIADGLDVFDEFDSPSRAQTFSRTHFEAALEALEGAD